MAEHTCAVDGRMYCDRCAELRADPVLPTKRVGIDADEMYPVYFVAQEDAFGVDYTYDVDTDTLERWETAAGVFVQAQSEMRAFVESQWRNRVDQ